MKNKRISLKRYVWRSVGVRINTYLKPIQTYYLLLLHVLRPPSGLWTQIWQIVVGLCSKLLVMFSHYMHLGYDWQKIFLPFAGVEPGTFNSWINLTTRLTRPLQVSISPTSAQAESFKKLDYLIKKTFFGIATKWSSFLSYRSK